MIKKRGLIFAVLILLIISFSFVSAGTLKVTEEHPFLINGEWISASQLQIGDELTTIDGKKVRITGIEDVFVSEDEQFFVYNLEAKEYSDFVVDGFDDGFDDGSDVGVVVHNSNALVVGNNPPVSKFYTDCYIEGIRPNSPYKQNPNLIVASLGTSTKLRTIDELTGLPEKDLGSFSNALFERKRGFEPPATIKEVETSCVLSYKSRDLWNDVFLRQLVREGKVSENSLFLEFGAALRADSSTAMRLSQIWPGEYIAFDLVGFNNAAKVSILNGYGIEVYSQKYSPMYGPLASYAGKADVIKFSHVSYYMTPEQLKISLGSINAMLKDNGYLIGNSFIFQKVRGQFKIISGSAHGLTPSGEIILRP